MRLDDQEASSIRRYLSKQELLPFSFRKENLVVAAIDRGDMKCPSSRIEDLPGAWRGDEHAGGDGRAIGSIGIAMNDMRSRGIRYRDQKPLRQRLRCGNRLLGGAGGEEESEKEEDAGHGRMGWGEEIFTTEAEPPPDSLRDSTFPEYRGGGAQRKYGDSSRLHLCGDISS
jgi:hypothetical protein